MNKAKRDGIGTPIRVYQVHFLHFLSYGIAILVCSLLSFSYLYWYDTQLKTNYLLFGFAIFVFLLWMLYIAYKRSYIAIYQNGIKIQSPTKNFFSSWENLKSLELVYHRHHGYHAIISTYESVDSLEVHGSYGQKHLPLYKQVPLSSDSVDKAALLETQFGQDLQRFAPQLFDQTS